MNQADFTLTGGRRHREVTYKHMQDGFIEVIENLLKGTGSAAPDGVILHGCEVTLTTTTIADDTAAITVGAVYIAGEVYTVDAATGIVRTASQDHVFKIVESTASPSLLYQDGTTVNPHMWCCIVE